MTLLKLILCPEDDGEFSIQTGGGVRANSNLPFYDQQGNKLSTIIRILNDVDMNLEDSEKEILKQVNLISDREEKINHDEIVKRIGEQIFASLFPSKVKEVLDRRWQSDFLHIQVQYEYTVSDNSYIHLYPWHLCYSNNSFIAKEKTILFSYSIGDNQLPKDTINKKNVEVVLIASDADTGNSRGEKISTNEFTDMIYETIKSASKKRSISLDKVYIPDKDKPTLNSLDEYISFNKSNSETASILHFFGHCVFKKNCTNRKCKISGTNKAIHCASDVQCSQCQQILSEPQGYLQFQASQGVEIEYVSAEKFAQKVSALNPQPILAIITACHSSLSFDGDTIYNGIAQQLIKQGISAVIAFPFRLTQESANSFSRGFYQALFEGDFSLLDALKKGMDECHHSEWYRSVIFLNQGIEIETLFQFEPNENLIHKNNSNKVYNKGYILIERADYNFIVEHYKNSCILSHKLDCIISVFEDLGIQELGNFMAYRKAILTTRRIFQKLPELNLDSQPRWLSEINLIDKQKLIEKYIDSHQLMKEFFSAQLDRDFDSEYEFSSDYRTFEALPDYNIKLEDFWWKLFYNCSPR